MKKLLLIASVLLLVITGCSSKKETSTDKNKTIKVGVAAGPYGDLFKSAIEPGLVELGYKVEIVEFTDYVQPNIALADGEIDVNLFQHLVYLENFKKEHKLKLEAIGFVPTAGAGIYSTEITSLKDLKKNSKVVISNDITNQARALRILEAAGLITFKADANRNELTPNDIDKNDYNLEIIAVEAPQTPRSLDSATLVVVNGNFAIGAGLDLKSALYEEVLDKDLKNVLAIRSSDNNSQLHKDLVSVLKSKEYQDAIEDKDNIFNTFQKPDYQLYK